ncbi:MAG: glycosyltransferase family 4 protein, partial [Candidatus Bathyarchaeota archaeon]|nr:glycosyltransferase family 4 protein [Candidatus Bathyarchaeota archaeon]
NVSEEELPLYYAACDVYVTCSRLEGFNLPLAEAQACGKPVVAFDIGPHREIVKKGYVIKPFDTVQFKEKVVELLTKKLTV